MQDLYPTACRQRNGGEVLDYAMSSYMPSTQTKVR